MPVGLLYGPPDGGINDAAKDQMGLPEPNWTPREGAIPGTRWDDECPRKFYGDQTHEVQLSPHSRNHDPP